MTTVTVVTVNRNKQAWENLEQFVSVAVALYMANKTMVDWITVLKVCVSKRHSLMGMCHVGPRFSSFVFMHKFPQQLQWENFAYLVHRTVGTINVEVTILHTLKIREEKGITFSYFSQDFDDDISIRMFSSNV